MDGLKSHPSKKTIEVDFKNKMKEANVILSWIDQNGLQNYESTVFMGESQKIKLLLNNYYILSTFSTNGVDYIGLYCADTEEKSSTVVIDANGEAWTENI